jgi:hypothetical protein
MNLYVHAHQASNIGLYINTQVHMQCTDCCVIGAVDIGYVTGRSIPGLIRDPEIENVNPEIPELENGPGIAVTSLHPCTWREIRPFPSARPKLK